MKKQFTYRTEELTVNQIKELTKEYGVNGNDILDVGVYLVRRALKQGKTIYDLQSEMYRNE